MEPSGWRIETVEDVPAVYGPGPDAVALGPDATPYLLYRVSEGELRRASWSEAGVTIESLWTCESEDGEGIAIAPDGTVVVAYVSNGVVVEKLPPDGGEWSVERMGVECVSLVALAVDGGEGRGGSLRRLLSQLAHGGPPRRIQADRDRVLLLLPFDRGR